MIDALTSAASTGLWYKPDAQKPTTEPAAPGATGAAPQPQPEAAAQGQAGAQSEGRSDGGDDEPSWMDRILEVGFRAYAEEIRQEKIQELREKILESMGLTEEDLEKMPPEERANVEKLIANEIAKRMAAQAELNGGDDGAKSMQMTYVHSHTTTVATTDIRVSALTAGALLDPGQGGVGLGPLLALQEQEAAEEGPARTLTDGAAQRGKNDRVDV